MTGMGTGFDCTGGPEDQLQSRRTRPSSVARVLRTSKSTRTIPKNGTNPAAITIGSKT